MKKLSFQVVFKTFIITSILFTGLISGYGIYKSYRNFKDNYLTSVYEEAKSHAILALSPACSQSIKSIKNNQEPKLEMVREIRKIAVGSD